MKVAVDEWLNEDAAEPERSRVFKLDETTYKALDRYVKGGIVNSGIKEGVTRIEKNWFDLGYDKKDGSQRIHMAGLYVFDKGVFLKYDGADIENRFSTTYTASLSLEEIRDILRS
jgi:hypothetical protein